MIHALLRHLEHAGFDGAPRVVGFDDVGREVLTYFEGEPASLHFPPALRHEHGIMALGRLIRRFHDAVATFVPAADAVYRIGARPLGPGEIVCHGDLGYWNTIWRGDDVVGLIDWDPRAGPAIRDVAVAAMTCVPMHGDEWALRVGFLSPLDRRGRLAALCAGYGDVTPAEVVQAAADAMTLEIERLQVLGAEGRDLGRRCSSAGRSGCSRQLPPGSLRTGLPSSDRRHERSRRQSARCAPFEQRR